MRASMTFRRITENQDVKVRENSFYDYEFKFKRGDRIWTQKTIKIRSHSLVNYYLVGKFKGSQSATNVDASYYKTISFKREMQSFSGHIGILIILKY